MSLGNPDVVQPSVEDLFELRIDCDPGYRVCCFLHSSILVVLLVISASYGNPETDHSALLSQIGHLEVMTLQRYSRSGMEVNHD